MTPNEYIKGLNAIKIMLSYEYAKTSPEQYKVHAECLDYGIKAIETVEKYKDAYHKGYKDGVEAREFHEELCREEMANDT